MNPHYEQALQFEKEKKYREAIDAYEKYFAEASPTLDDYINLFVIYHDILEGVTWCSLGVTPKESDHFWERRFQLLDEAEKKFGACTEIDFWRKYTDWVHIGEPFDCEELAARGDSLLPFFFLFVTTPDFEEQKKYASKCKELYEQVKDRSTIKKQILESFIRQCFDDIARYERKKEKERQNLI